MIGSLGFTEIAFILVLALLIFGPKKLPEMGRMLGRGMGEFRRASDELKRTFNAEMSLAEEESKAAPPKPELVPKSEPPQTVARQASAPVEVAEKPGEEGEAPVEEVKGLSSDEETSST